MSKEFKFRTLFKDIRICAASSDESDRLISRASLSDIAKLKLPDSLKLDENLDLIAVVYNACVVNRLNKNGEAIDTTAAKVINGLFLHKYQNIEHNLKRIVGHIVSTGWSSFGDNKLLSDSDIENSVEPFNLTLGGVVYRIADNDFSELLLDSMDESSPNYMKVSASWELAFNDYYIVLGSRNIHEAEKITDPKQIKEFSKYLIRNGGSGKTKDGVIVGKVAIGTSSENILPFGIGFTARPAAEVQGVTLPESYYAEQENEAEDEESKEREESDAKIIENTENKNSQNQDIAVISITNITTMPKTLAEIKDLLLAKELPAEEICASLTEALAETIEKKSVEWEKTANAKSEELSKATATIETLQQSLATLTEQVKQLETEKQNRILAETFQSRMSALDSEFELNAEDSRVVASKIKTMNEDEYKQWYSEFSILAAPKSRANIAKAKEAVTQQVNAELEKQLKNRTVASEQPAVELALAVEHASEDNSQGGLPNASSSKSNSQESLVNEWREAFKDSMSINLTAKK